MKLKEDRLALLAATRRTSSDFPDDAGSPFRGAFDPATPQLATDADGVRHDAFRISTTPPTSGSGLVKNAEAIIADGHHR
jgi:hypothetical protein